MIYSLIRRLREKHPSHRRMWWSSLSALRWVSYCVVVDYGGTSWGVLAVAVYTRMIVKCQIQVPQSTKKKSQHLGFFFYDQQIDQKVAPPPSDFFSNKPFWKIPSVQKFWFIDGKKNFEKIKRFA